MTARSKSMARRLLGRKARLGMALVGLIGLLGVVATTSLVAAPAAAAGGGPTADACMTLSGGPAISSNDVSPAYCGCLGTRVAPGIPTGGCSFPVSLCPTGEISCSGASSATSGGSATATEGCITVTGLLGEGGLIVGLYGSDPDAALSSASEFFDVYVAPSSTFLDLTIMLDLDQCQVTPGSTLDWWNGSAWVPVSGDPGPTYNEGPPPTLTVTLNGSTSPTPDELTGTPFAMVVVPSFSPPLGGTAVANPNGTTNFVVPTVP